jgi:hypothetical protein
LTLPALPFPKYNISNLYLFPTYATREDYQAATGQEAPAWNPYRQPKSWFDPKAKESVSRRVVYEYALAINEDTGALLRDANGLPYLDALVLDRDEAATVNIPPKGPGMTNVPGADVPEVPVPMRALEPNEQLYFDWGSILMVKNTDLFEQSSGDGFSQADRDLLKKIAARLQVQ